MTSALPADRLLARAFVASLALHLMLLALIPPLTVSDGTQAIETISFARLLRVVIQHPIERHAAVAAAQAPVHARAARTPDRATRVTLVHHPQRALPPAPAIAAAPVMGEVRAGTVAAATSDPPAVAPSAPSAPERTAAPPARAAIGGMMPLGADEASPVLDPSVAKSLAALAVHVTLTVTVDAQGHTKSVAFDPRLDAATEERIRALLDSASWDPAVCGAGMACESSTTITL